MKHYYTYVYVLELKDQSIYIGYTYNITTTNRLAERQTG